MSDLYTIKHIVLDPTYLVYLRVMRRMIIKVWMGPGKHSFSDAEKKYVSNSIVMLKKCFSREYKRTGCPLDDVKF